MELFTLTLEKATEENGRYYVSGVASNTDKDLQNDAMSVKALKQMADTAVGLPITRSHANELGDELGKVTEAKLDDNQLFVKAELDPNDPEAMRYFNKISKGAKAGFSIGGTITRVAPSLDKSVRVIDGVALDHIMLTNKPALPSTFATALRKAIDSYLEDYEAELNKAVNPTDEQRESHATYFEDVNGKKVGKFPIWNAASAESALHLIGKAPADKQPLIRERACAILGDSHPSCQNAKKSEDLNTMENETVLKAGAKFSEDTLNQMKAIHANAGPDIQAQLKALVGDQVDSSFWDMDDGDASADDANNSDEIAQPNIPEPAEPLSPNGDNPEDGTSVAPINVVVDKSLVDAEVEKALAPLRKAYEDKIKALDEAVALFKAETAKLTVNKSVPATDAKPTKFTPDVIRKGSFTETDLMKNLLLNATRGSI